MPPSEIAETKINNTLRLVQSKFESEALSLLKEVLPYCHWVEICYKHSGDTILHCAARNGLEEIVEYLIRNSVRNSDINYKNKDNRTALHEAAQSSQFRICQILLRSGADLHALKKGDWTPLMLACTKRNAIETVKVLLCSGASIYDTNKDGWSSIHFVAREGDEHLFKYLCEYFANVCQKTKNGRTPLHIAALHGNLAIVEILLNLNVEVNSRDVCGNSPLCEAILGNHLEICHKLLEYGADSTVINNCGYSLIHLAAFESHIEMLEFILKSLKVDINFKNKNNVTALHCAARKKKTKAYSFLVMNGASEDIVDNYYRTPLNYLNS